MPLDPNALAQAFVATPFVDDAPIFGDGRGFIPLNQGAFFVKFVAVGGFTYTVGENEIPGNPVVLGPNGQPISPGFAPATDQTIEFSPATTGLYLIVIVPHPQTVAAGQEVLVTIQASQLGLTDPSFGGGINLGPTFDPSFGLVGQVLNGNLSGINPPANTVQYVLHPPDGNGKGLGTAERALTENEIGTPKMTFIDAVGSGEHAQGTTMFSSMIHESSDAIAQPNSVLGNMLPDSNDVAAAQSLYGAPTQAIFGSQANVDFYDNLIKFSDAIKSNG